MKYFGKVLNIIYDIFSLGCVILTAYAYCEDFKNIVKHWLDE